MKPEAWYDMVQRTDCCMLSLAAPALPNSGVRCLSVPLSVSRLTAVTGRLGRLPSEARTGEVAFAIGSEPRFAPLMVKIIKMVKMVKKNS